MDWISSAYREPTPSTAEYAIAFFVQMMVTILVILCQLCLPILIIALVLFLAGEILGYINSVKLKNRIMKSSEDLHFRWADIHIDGKIKKLLLDNVTRPLTIRQSPPKMQLSPDALLPKGLLFSGPTGTGKSLLAMIVAKESNCNFLSIDASDFRDAYYGESEKKIRSIFAIAKKYQPCILFIDEIDTIMSARTAQRGWDVENSIKGVFLTYWDGIHSKKKGKSSSVVIIGATNRPKSLDPAFLRRLDLNIEIPLPNLLQRKRILRILLKTYSLEDNFDIKKIAEAATGFTGADLGEAVRYAVMSCNAEYHKKLESEIIKDRVNEEKKEESRLGPFYSLALLKEYLRNRLAALRSRIKYIFSKDEVTVKMPKIPITMTSMEESIAHSKKSRSSGGGVGGLDSTEMLITSNLIHPNDIETTWGDIAGCDDIIQSIKSNLILPMKMLMDKKFKPSKFLQCPKGILLHGPPGSGKTLLAKAVARHSGCTFINLEPSMLESKWVGEISERTAALFRVAEKYQPCIIFIDEIDAFLRERRSSDSEWSAGKKAQFLSLLDGILTDPTKVIILMGATNRLSDIDAALLRRLTLKFCIDAPDRNKRREILNLLLKEEKLCDDVCLDRLVDATDNMTGADLKDILRAAIIESLKESYVMLDQVDEPRQKTNNSTNEKIHDCKTIEVVTPIEILQSNVANNNSDIEMGKSTKESKDSLIMAGVEESKDSQDIVTENVSSISMISQNSDPRNCLTPPLIVEIKMNHFITAIENFKKSKQSGTDAPMQMYC